MRCLGTAGLFLVTLTACGGPGQNAGGVVRPADPTLGTATGEKAGTAAICREVGASGQPLVVDWEAEQRTDLEAAMRTGVAIVHYDCTSIKLLSACKLEGRYGFTGTSTQEKVLVLNDADAAQANLPLSGAKLGASLERGTSLDIALLIVGKQMSASSTADRKLLQGDCATATHFVRGAWVGAFAMKTGTVGKVAAGAQIFGVGAGAESSSSKIQGNKSGSIESCKAADPDQPKPPSGCGAAVRVDLVALAEKGQEPEIKPGLTCPKGLVAIDGVCTTAAVAPSVPETCDGLDGKGCLKQCAAGDLQSCSNAAFLYYLGVELPKDPAKEVALLEKGCADTRPDTLGVKADMCSRLANRRWNGEGTAKDPVGAVKVEERACGLGLASSCGKAGRVLLGGLYGTPADPPRGATFLQKGCNGGFALACVHLADAYRKGRAPLTADKGRAIGLYQQACDGDASGCVELAEMTETGEGVAADPAKAKSYLARACKRGDKSACAKMK